MKNKIIALVLLGSILLTGCKSTNTANQTLPTTGVSASQETNEVEFTYVFAENDANKIVEDLDSVFVDIRNMVGRNKDDITNINGHAPARDYFSFDFEFVAFNYYDKIPHPGCVTEVFVIGFDTDMSGQIVVKDNNNYNTSAYIEFKITDFNTAKEIYEIYAARFDLDTDNRDNAMWQAFSKDGEFTISLSKTLDYYSMRITQPIKV